MQRAAFGFILAMASTVVHGGYDEFTILDFTRCKSYTLTSDWGDAEFRSKEAKQQFERDRAIAGFGSDGQIYALLGELDEPASFAGCDYQVSHIECKRIGNFPYAVLKCPFGKSRSEPWVRTCQVNTDSSASVRMYWVDTSENEDGSERVHNQFLFADFKRFNAKCKRPV
jgi:hypothetical protein